MAVPTRYGSGVGLLGDDGLLGGDGFRGVDGDDGEDDDDDDEGEDEGSSGEAGALVASPLDPHATLSAASAEKTNVPVDRAPMRINGCTHHTTVSARRHGHNQR